MIPSISVSHHPPEYSTNITFIHKNKKNSLFPSVPNAVSYLNTFSDIYFCAILHSCSKLYCVVVFSTNHCLFECVAPTAKNSSVIHSFIFIFSSRFILVRVAVEIESAQGRNLSWMECRASCRHKITHLVTLWDNLA